MSDPFNNNRSAVGASSNPFNPAAPSPGSTRGSRIAPLKLLLIAGFFMFLLSLGFSFLYSNTEQDRFGSTLITSNLLMHSQRIAKAAPKAVAGNAEAFKQLQESVHEMNGGLKMLARGGDYLGLHSEPLTDTQKHTLNSAERTWAGSNGAASIILALKPELISFGTSQQEMTKLTPALEELAIKIQTLQVQGGGTPREILVSSQLIMLSQRMARSAIEFSANDGISPETAFLLGKDANTFSTILDGFLNGSETLGLSPTKSPDINDRLHELQTRFRDYQGHASSILSNLQKLISAKQSEALIYYENEQVKQSLIQLQKACLVNRGQLNWAFLALLMSGFMVMVLAWLASSESLSPN